MKKQLLVCAFAFGTFLMAGCNSTPDNHETTITETGTVATDTVGMEMDNTRVEIEEASAEVDSLLNDI